MAGTPVGTSLIDAHAGGVGVMESVPVTDPGSTGYFSFICFLTTQHLYVVIISVSIHN